MSDTSPLPDNTPRTIMGIPIPRQSDEEAAKTERRLKLARVNLSVTVIGECLADLGNIIIQLVYNPNSWDHNAAKRGSIACGLERAAAYVRGDALDPSPAKQHASIKSIEVPPLVT